MSSNLKTIQSIINDAQMFDGFDSVSFKIKRKHLVKCMKLFK